MYYQTFPHITWSFHIIILAKSHFQLVENTLFAKSCSWAFTHVRYHFELLFHLFFILLSFTPSSSFFSSFLHFFCFTFIYVSLITRSVNLHSLKWLYSFDLLSSLCAILRFLSESFLSFFLFPPFWFLLDYLASFIHQNNNSNSHIRTSYLSRVQDSLAILLHYSFFIFSITIWFIGLSLLSSLPFIPVRIHQDLDTCLNHTKVFLSHIETYLSCKTHLSHKKHIQIARYLNCKKHVNDCKPMRGVDSVKMCRKKGMVKVQQTNIQNWFKPVY